MTCGTVLGDYFRMADQSAPTWFENRSLSERYVVMALTTRF
jgi:hypothetical protein